MLLLPEIFDKNVIANPQGIAIDIPSGRRHPCRRTITYAQLHAASCAIANAIAESANVASDSIVAILLPRDTESLYAAQLGVLNIGAAFTCLDPLFPDEHIRSVLIDADAAVILTDCVADCANCGWSRTDGRWRTRASHANFHAPRS